MGTYEPDDKTLNLTRLLGREPAGVPPSSTGAVAAEPDPAPRQVVEIVLRYWKVVMAMLAACGIAAILTLALIDPLFEADALVQVERPEQSDRQIVSRQLSALTGTETALSAEIELLRSRQVLEPVIDALHLDRIVEVPLAERIAALVTQARTGVSLAPLRIDRLVVPDALRGRLLVLTAGQDHGYTLSLDGALLLEGVVGALVKADTASGPVEMKVDALDRPAGWRAVVQVQPRIDTIDDLRRRFQASEQGKDSGLIRLNYRGPDPVQAAAVVNLTARTYRDLEIAWNGERARRSLAFLESQLPALQERVNRAESALARQKVVSGAPDMTAETTLLMQQSVAAEDGLQRLRQQRQELSQRFTTGHPSMMALDAQIEQASLERGRIEQRLSRLPGSQRELAGLTRDLEVNMRLYVAMLEEMQQLRLASSGVVGAVRIVDSAATPSEPVFPRPGTTLLAALIAGLLTGLGVAVLLASLRKRVDQVRDLERATGLRCLAAIPGRVRRRFGPGRSSGDDEARALGVRHLRSALLTHPLSANGGTVLVAGSQAEVAAGSLIDELGEALTSAGFRCLRLELDYRGERPSPEGHAGSSDYLLCRAHQIEPLVQSTGPGRPDLLPVGQSPLAARDRMPPQRLRSLLAGLRSRYDYVLVDVPPLDVYGESLLVASCVDATVLVSRQGLEPQDRVASAVRRLREGGAALAGTVLDGLRTSDRLGYLGAAAGR